MDIARPDLKRKRRRKRIACAVVACVLLAAMIFGVSRIKPAIPKVDRDSVWVGQVERGDMLRQVRGIGSLIPEEIRWITARTTGRVAPPRQNVIMPEVSGPGGGPTTLTPGTSWSPR